MLPINTKFFRSGRRLAIRPRRPSSASLSRRLAIRPRRPSSASLSLSPESIAIDGLANNLNRNVISFKLLSAAQRCTCHNCQICQRRDRPHLSAGCCISRCLEQERPTGLRVTFRVTDEHFDVDLSVGAMSSNVILLVVITFGVHPARLLPLYPKPTLCTQFGEIIACHCCCRVGKGTY